ncbi:MAG: Fic family protein [Solirubrobacterales bacterium]
MFFIPKERAYARSHPHVDFNVDLRTSPPHFWALLGKATSKSQHIARALLDPEASRELMEVYLARGVLATTAIEGNTLSEEEVRGVLEGTLKLPPSREYLQREVENVLAAYNDAYGEILADPAAPMTVDWLCRFNERILRDLELDEGVVRGEIRTGSVVVGRYRAVPAADAEYLLQRLCDWLNGSDFDAPGDQPELGAPLAITKAMVAHLYLAWIHPFGDGNGRTARLLELQILLRAGFPAPTCQLLSNHYNLTRTEYYRRLDEASRARDEMGFLVYAARGFVDQLKEQLETIFVRQFADRWEQFVYQTFGGATSPSEHRRIRVALELSRRSSATGEPVLSKEIPQLSPELARAYATKTGKTLTRDVNALKQMGLIAARGRGLVPTTSKIQGLWPEVEGGVLLD